MTRIEARGVTCLDCAALDLQKEKEAARAGFGWCPAHAVPHFVAFAMARNCADFAPSDPEVANLRAEWAERQPMFWQRKRA